MSTRAKRTTYYCYTNSGPDLVNIADTADGNGRISIRRRWRSVPCRAVTGWMNHLWRRHKGQNGDAKQYDGQRHKIRGLVGMNYDTLGEEYYKQAGCLVLKQNLSVQNKQFTKYDQRDGRRGRTQRGGHGVAGGGTAAWQAGKRPATNANVTPAGTVVYVGTRLDVYETEHIDDGRAANNGIQQPGSGAPGVQGLLLPGLRRGDERRDHQEKRHGIQRQ